MSDLVAAITTDPSTWDITTPELYIGNRNVSNGDMYIANISISGRGCLHLEPIEMLLDAGTKESMCLCDTVVKGLTVDSSVAEKIRYRF